MKIKINGFDVVFGFGQTVVFGTFPNLFIAKTALSTVIGSLRKNICILLI